MKNFHIKQPCILDKPLTPALQNWQTYFQHFNGIVDDKKTNLHIPGELQSRLQKFIKFHSKLCFSFLLSFVVLQKVPTLLRSKIYLT